MINLTTPWPKAIPGDVLITEEDYERARLCTDACEGISSSTLKLFRRVVMNESLADLRRQRDELLDMLKDIVANPNEANMAAAKAIFDDKEGG